MSSIEKRTISLPTRHAAYIDSLVKSGLYGSASEVVRAGLRALQERHAAVERWPREDVAAAYDALRADPERAVPAKDAFDEIRTRHAEKLKANR
ncbi:type II toxin-antitoxin system ParD family antitoxin [Stappia sp. GBMRC 2046]|uniref:Type II toxin-antitoxin system ParD family antitoxin n=1 Tax=Stappia sediminis TaxID=2692190 RepID=A0A7X3S8C8_9HYPH|nr:type II toxin-antitoxin system ParD family antitoxin [Stappia sediminis]MXN65716.1 type II toxin-antitoxin system ParD family antitoxin [Stappia sediminis]